MSSFFGNPLMLLAFAAISLPWIIEWLFRRRKRQVDLPTILFLLRNKEQENIKRQDQILMMLRILALFLLILAMARPQVQRGLVGGAKERKVIMLLDATASMNQQAGVTTSFGLAQKKAAALIRGIEGDASVTVVRLGAHAEVAFESQTDVHTAAAEVDALRGTLGGAPIRDALAWVKGYLDEKNDDGYEIYIFSDFQNYTWAPPGGQTAESSRILKQLYADNEVFLVDVGSEPEFNYIVTELRPSEWVMSTGMPVVFKVMIETWGKPPKDAKPTVTFLVNGIKKDVREFVPGDQAAIINFEHSFAQSGEFLVEILVNGDQHMIDNRRTYLCTVPDHFGILILDETAPMISGGPTAGPGNGPVIESNPLDQESIFLARAISPPTHPGMEKVTRFSSKIVHPSLLKFENMDSYRVVVVTQLGSLDEATGAKLEGYVSAGGSLWIFLGPDLNIYEYNKYLFKEGKGPLPCKLVSKATEGADAKARPHLRFGEGAHPALHALSGSGQKDAQFLGFYKVEIAEGARVVTTLSDSSPALIEKEYGRGRVMLANTTAGVDWSYMPAVLEYPIFVQDMLRYLVGNPDKYVNLDAGDRFHQLVFVSTQHLLLRLPNGKKVRLTPQARENKADAWEISFDKTDQQGLYSLVGVPEGVVPRTRFVVNQTSQEGDLSRMDEKGFKGTFGKGRYMWVSPDIPIEDLSANLHAVTEFAQYILWLLIIALGVEAFLAMRFGRRRGKAPVTT